jgi:hypothetical protein
MTIFVSAIIGNENECDYEKNIAENKYCGVYHNASALHYLIPSPLIYVINRARRFLNPTQTKSIP